MAKWSARAPRVSKTNGLFNDPAASSETDRGHDLESHLIELRALNLLRLESGQLRDDGWKALDSLINERKGKDDLVARLEAIFALSSHVPRKPQDKEAERRQTQRAWAEALAAEIDLSRLAENKRSVVTAARALRLFAGHPSMAMSKTAILCWYWIMRETYTAAMPDWAVGGARASHERGGWVSAYVTAQCVFAIEALANSLEKTAQYFEEFEKSQRLFAELRPSGGLPTAWTDIEYRRLVRSRRLALSMLAMRASAELHAPSESDEVAAQETFAPKVATRAEELLECLGEELSAAKKEIQAAWETETKREDAKLAQTTSERVRDGMERHRAVATAGHKIALMAIDKGIVLTGNTKRDLGKDWATVAAHFLATARAVREGLDVRPYLSSVIDAQLAHGSSADSHRLDLGEMAFAARAYFCNAEPLGSEAQRLVRVIRCLSDNLSSDGTLPSRRPYHSFDVPEQGPAGFIVDSAEVLTAIAELMRYARYPVQLGIARKLLSGFVERRVMKGPDPLRLKGWRREMARPGRSSNGALEPTAQAVSALIAINDLLDDGINDIVLDHFEVTEPQSEGLTLDNLFYSDYGLHKLELIESPPRGEQRDPDSTPNAGRDEAQGAAGVEGKRGKHTIGHRSIALTLQDMQAHVGRFGAETLHSLVLFGPAGTGKTTLVEALANSCEVPRVEVTPSDIAKAGEVALEQRARAVFEALAFLTRVVILFDEFDPILKRRDFSGSSAPSFFSFLTPGMLPKLKNLSDNAKNRSVAYVLITNLIGTLDEAAVRKGRFDESVGVFPPDPLSRVGQFVRNCNRASEKAKLPPERSRLLDVVVKTAGAGMTVLGSDGWFTRGKVPKEPVRRGTPLAYVFGKCELEDIAWPDPEARFEGIKGTGPTAELECRQWGWIAAWDRRVAAAKSQDLEVQLTQLRGPSVSEEQVPVDGGTPAQ